MVRARGCLRVLLLRALVLPALLLAALAPGAALAQAAADVAERSAGALPRAPEGYVHERIGHVTWEYHSRADAVAEDLKEAYRDEWPRITRELGGGIDDALTIRIGRDPDEMAALAPMGEPPPAYASGVAYPARGLILLTLAAPETWERPDVESVLAHELSHIALHRAVRGNEIPRWFSEGVAIHQAGEHDLERVRTLWSATVAGRLLPMERLGGAFASHPHRVSLAYAESADFVRWLRARDDGDARFRELLRRLGRGQSFETSLHRTYSIGMQSLEIEWHDSLAERFQAWPLLFGSGGLWVLAALLIVVAYVRRKRRDRAKLREWEEEDEQARRAIEALAAREVVYVAAEEEKEREVLYVLPPEPRHREAGVPTVEHEGRSHTLH